MNTTRRTGWLRCLISGLALFVLIFSAAGTAIPARAQANQQQTYVVKTGETLFRIALRYGVTVESLVAANNLVDPSHIYAGQTLIIPGAVVSITITPNPVVSGPVYYHVQVGDTLNRIALAYGVSVQAIMSANNLADANHIEVGQALIIPGVAAPGGSATVPQLPAVTPVSSPTALPPTVSPTASPTAIPPTTTALPTMVPPTVTAAPTVLPAAAAPVKTYTVQAGEGLAAIARRFGVAWTAVAAANNISDPNLIYAGMVLKIPAPSTGAPPTTMETSAGVPPGPLTGAAATANKQIVVVLHEERIYAYENGVLVRNVLVSTGLPGTPTVIGTYHIYVKYTAQLMVGPDYYLPNVPWVMYFYEGYGLHGTYWHHNWGHPMSHGCVNMPTDEAKWMYDWAPVGTTVTVMW